MCNLPIGKILNTDTTTWTSLPASAAAYTVMCANYTLAFFVWCVKILSFTVYLIRLNPKMGCLNRPYNNVCNEHQPILYQKKPPCIRFLLVFFLFF